MIRLNSSHNTLNRPSLIEGTFNTTLVKDTKNQSHIKVHSCLQNAFKTKYTINISNKTFTQQYSQPEK